MAVKQRLYGEPLLRQGTSTPRAGAGWHLRPELSASGRLEKRAVGACQGKPVHPRRLPGWRAFYRPSDRGRYVI